MNNKIFVKPGSPGLQVLNFERKDYRPLDPEGEWVTDSPQWRRYLKSGDVILSTPEQPKISKKGDKA